MVGGGQSSPETTDFVTFERLIHLQLSVNGPPSHPRELPSTSSFQFICRVGADEATVMENSTLGCESVTQDVMAEVISPGPNFSGNWVLTHRAAEIQWHSCTKSSLSQSQFVSQGKAKNDPERVIQKRVNNLTKEKLGEKRFVYEQPKPMRSEPKLIDPAA